MNLNINAVIFWIVCGLVAFGFGAGAPGIALTVAAAMAFSIIVSLLD
jgi:hypothetical protein